MLNRPRSLSSPCLYEKGNHNRPPGGRGLPSTVASSLWQGWGWGNNKGIWWVVWIRSTPSLGCPTNPCMKLHLPAAICSLHISQQDLSTLSHPSMMLTRVFCEQTTKNPCTSTPARQCCLALSTNQRSLNTHITLGGKQAYHKPVRFWGRF